MPADTLTDDALDVLLLPGPPQPVPEPAPVADLSSVPFRFPTIKPEGEGWAIAVRVDTRDRHGLSVALAAVAAAAESELAEVRDRLLAGGPAKDLADLRSRLAASRTESERLAAEEGETRALWKQAVAVGNNPEAGRLESELDNVGRLAGRASERTALLADRVRQSEVDLAGALHAAVEQAAEQLHAAALADEATAAADLTAGLAPLFARWLEQSHRRQLFSKLRIGGKASRRYGRLNTPEG